MENKCNVFFPVGFAMFAHSQRGLASDAFRHERRLVTPASIGEIVYVAVGAIYIAAARDLPQVGMKGHYLWFVHGNPHFLTQSQLWTVVGRPLGFKQFFKKDRLLNPSWGERYGLSILRTLNCLQLYDTVSCGARAIGNLRLVQTESN